MKSLFRSEPDLIDRINEQVWQLQWMKYDALQFINASFEPVATVIVKETNREYAIKNRLQNVTLNIFIYASLKKCIF